MIAVYYYDPALDDCPVKVYLRRIPTSDRIKIIANIDAKIGYIVENPGLHAASFIGTLHGYSFLELKHRKNDKTVIRILYYRYNDQIVLLNAFEKPDNYVTQRQRRKIEKKYQETDIYLEEFLKQPNNYEIYR